MFIFGLSLGFILGALMGVLLTALVLTELEGSDELGKHIKFSPRTWGCTDTDMNGGTMHKLFSPRTWGCTYGIVIL